MKDFDDESKEVYDCTGLRVIDPTGKIEDYDPIDHDEFMFTDDYLIITQGSYVYKHHKESEVIPYLLFQEVEDGTRVGWIRRDLAGNLLEG